MIWKIVVRGLFSLLLMQLPLAAQTATIAAAADLQGVLPEIADRYQKQTGKAVQVVYGSSGNLAQQIRNGAPFDVFFSANMEYAKKLDADGFAEPNSLFEYAIGKIVLWVPNESKLDVSRGLRSLTDSSVHKIAVANPEHAPYGQAAVAALKKEGLYDPVRDKLVLGENISQAAAFVASGAADAGVIALSLTRSPNLRDKGRSFEIPAEDYPPIEQACVIVKASPNKDAARSFLTFFRTPEAQELLAKYGFAAPAKR